MSARYTAESHTLDELGFIGRGRSRHRPRNDAILFGADYPFIQTADVKRAPLIIKQFDQMYNEVGLAQSKLWPPGTLCITIAANIAENAILGIESCFPDSIVGFNPNPEKADLYFIKYYLDYLKARMLRTSQGATQDNLPLEKLLSFKFLVPKDIEIQRALVAGLLAADRFADNCLQRAEVLERVGDVLFLRTIGDGRSNGATNSIAFGDIAQPSRFNLQPSRSPSEVFFHYSMPAFDSSRLPALERGSQIRSNKYLIDHHFVLLSKLNPHIPRVWLPLKQTANRSIASTEFIPLKSITPFTRESIFFLCRSWNFTRALSPRANGTSTSHQRIGPDDVQRLRVQMIPRNEAGAFADRLAPLIDSSQNLRKIAAVVQEMRSANLPHVFDRLYETNNLAFPSSAQHSAPGSDMRCDEAIL